MPEIVEIKGVGPVLAKACAENGYVSVEKIAAAMVAEFVAVPGVSEARARQLIDAAKVLLNGASSPNGALPAAMNVESEKIQAKKGNAKKKKNNKKSKKQKDKKKTSGKKKNKKNKKKSGKK